MLYTDINYRLWDKKEMQSNLEKDLKFDALHIEYGSWQTYRSILYATVCKNFHLEASFGIETPGYQFIVWDKGFNYIASSKKLKNYKHFINFLCSINYPDALTLRRVDAIDEILNAIDV